MMQEKGEEKKLDWLREERRGMTESRGGGDYPKYIKKKEC